MSQLQHKMSMIICFVISPLFLNCGSSTSHQGKITSADKKDSFTTTSSDTELNSRYTKVNQDLKINEGLSLKSADSIPSLKLIGEVKSPVVGSVTLKASSVMSEDEKSVYVSYIDLEELSYKGAIDLFSIKNPEEPSLSSNFSSQKHDVAYIYAEKDKVYFAGSRNYYSDSSAVFGEIVLNDNGKAKSFKEIEIESYMANYIFEGDKYFYVTSGDNGGLNIVDKDKFEVVETINEFDARSVWTYKDNIYLYAAQEGRIIVLDEDSLAELNRVDIGGANTPEDKTLITKVKNKFFIAQGDEGFSIMCIDDNSILAQMQAEAHEDINDSPHYTMNIAVKDDFIYTASGGFGVNIYQMNKDWDKNKCEPITLKKVANFSLPDDAPATHVFIDKSFLFVAAGEQGMKIIRINKKGKIPTEYTNWAENEPNDSKGEDCVEVYKNGEWNDQDCKDKRHFACVKKSDRSKWKISDDDGKWYEHDEVCPENYEFSYPKNEDETYYLSEVTEEKTWINLNDIDEEGVFNDDAVE